jgi:hypothetical protein
MLALMSFIVVFHLLVLSGVIPYSVVWGGRLENVSQMHMFETASLIVNLAIIVVIAIKGGYLKPFLSKRTIAFILWALVILFSLNTIGNLLSKNSLEKILFTPLTLFSAVLCYRMVIES